MLGEEVKRALYGVGQMREVMWRNERKHEHLMKSLHHSGEKKKVDTHFYCPCVTLAVSTRCWHRSMNKDMPAFVVVSKMKARLYY